MNAATRRDYSQGGKTCPASQQRKARTTLVRGVFLCVYVILDLLSRHVVGWMVSCKENAGLAKHLFKHALKARQIDD